MKNNENPLFEMNNDILFDLVIDIKYKELNPITKELLLSSYNTLGNFTESMIEEMFNLKPLLTGVNDTEIVKNFLNTNLK